MIGIAEAALNQCVQRQRSVKTTNPLGEQVDNWEIIAPLSIQAQILPIAGHPDFASSEGRTDQSTHLMVYNALQYQTLVGPSASGPSVPYAEVTYVADVLVADRIQDAQGLTYRVDLVQASDGQATPWEGGHYEARLTLFLPGGEAREG